MASTTRGRRDVFLSAAGSQWEVQAQTGGATGPVKTHHCPSRATAQMLADAWMGGRPEWRELAA